MIYPAVGGWSRGQLQESRPPAGFPFAWGSNVCRAGERTWTASGARIGRSAGYPWPPRILPASRSPRPLAPD